MVKPQQIGEHTLVDRGSVAAAAMMADCRITPIVHGESSPQLLPKWRL
jgi:hypothetical protein